MVIIAKKRLEYWSNKKADEEMGNRINKQECPMDYLKQSTLI